MHLPHFWTGLKKTLHYGFAFTVTVVGLAIIIVLMEEAESCQGIRLTHMFDE